MSNLSSKLEYNLEILEKLIEKSLFERIASESLCKGRRWFKIEL